MNDEPQAKPRKSEGLNILPTLVLDNGREGPIWFQSPQVKGSLWGDILITQREYDEFKRKHRGYEASPHQIHTYTRAGRDHRDPG